MGTLRNVNICVGKILGISIRECLKAAVETRLVCDSQLYSSGYWCVGCRDLIGPSGVYTFMRLARNRKGGVSY